MVVLWWLNVRMVVCGKTLKRSSYRVVPTAPSVLVYVVFFSHEFQLTHSLLAYSYTVASYYNLLPQLTQRRHLLGVAIASYLSLDQTKGSYSLSLLVLLHVYISTLLSFSL